MNIPQPLPPSEVKAGEAGPANGARANKGEKKKKGVKKKYDGSAKGGKVEAANAPDYIAHRLKVWDAAVAARALEQLSLEGDSSAPEDVKITITLPDGSTKEAVKGKTSPMDVAMGISETLGRKALVALVNGEQWDMERPFTSDSTLAICTFDTPEGKNTMWHSTAHMLGEALEFKYGGQLCIGPPLEDGFYYDIHLGPDAKVTEADFEDINKRIQAIAKEKRTFQRLELTKSEAKDMFSYNEFKLEIIEALDENSSITAYRDGPFIDLCRGPHVPNSTRVKAMMVKSTSQAYWRGDDKNASLQRVYGISFPEKKLLKEYKHFVAEAAKRDHRVLGPKQELIWFSPLSPGCAFFLPHGQRIFHTLMDFIRDQYWERGYSEVQTPNMFDFKLWETSGHAEKYKENMFQLQVEKAEYGLKPMNCPSHCLIFGSKARSYRELPIRMADNGVLHRNEKSGTLGGLTRVRRFQQDDGHIFCCVSQVTKEVQDYLHFFKFVYDKFGYTYEFDLSTRPEKAIGTSELWDLAEKMLSDALVEFTGKQCGEDGGWSINEGDGAFYGPKIDIKIFDALKRKHQCATIQLDFQLPIRFNLQYQKSPAETSTIAALNEGVKEGFARPVIIHRAIYGSFERFFAILIEHYGGFWPFWLSPRQAIVVPVSEKFIQYAQSVQKQLRRGKFHVELDSSDRTLGKKLAEARNHYFNFILVVGANEMENNNVNVRTRGIEETEIMKVVDIEERFQQLRKDFK